MKFRLWTIVPALAALLLLPGLLKAETSAFQPDPRTVLREGPAYRYPQAGWIVLHIEGEPYERGVQHGKLLSSEIAAHVRCFASMYSPEAPRDAWKLLRTMTQSMFLSRFDREYLEEMRGIADGASANGATFDNRPLDVTDIAALNLWPEIMCLRWGAQAVPTGLEGLRFPHPDRSSPPPTKPGHCSAFAATGPATADGKIVFGHITMFSLYPSTFYNIWLDIKPATGHRIVMQTYPGGIQSGMDYYINDAGIMVSETTIEQTHFDISGTPLAGRIRKALQYSESIDQVVETLQKANNGLYTNEWMIADTKTNEIAMFELGTHTSKLYRSSKGEWFGGTEGFYWGCNNAKDLAVRLETIAATNDRPENLIWRPTARDLKWIDLYKKNKGKIGVAFGKEAFTTAPIASAASVDAKFTNTDMAGRLESWAIFGPPREKVWEPTDEEKRKYPEVGPLVPNPWTILTSEPPSAGSTQTIACDLESKKEKSRLAKRDEDEDEELREPALPRSVVWRGTLLPKTDADIWLASAFAEYHAIVEREIGMQEVAKKECLCSTDLDKLSIGLFRARSRYLTAAATAADVPLNGIKSEIADDAWYKIASGKGVLVLNELRRQVGGQRFAEAMDAFGFANAGKPVAWRDFAAALAPASGANLDDFFAYWVGGSGLPRFRLADARVKTSSTSGEYSVAGKLVAEQGPLPANVPVTLETTGDEETRVVDVAPKSGEFRVTCDAEPKRLIVDKYGQMAKANGGMYSIGSWMGQQDQTLIVYGTEDEEIANRAAAKVVQKSIRDRSYDFIIPIRSDADVTEDEIRSHYLILIGRPSTNRLTNRFQSALPVAFDRQSFDIRGKVYGHYRSGLIAAGANPERPQFGLVTIAGLSATATYLAAADFVWSDLGAEVFLLAHGEKPQALVIPAPELIKELGPQGDLSAGSAK